MINKKVTNVGVDAGIIMIADRAYFEERNPGFLNEKLSKVIEVPTGKYKVEWKIPKTWNGAVSGNGILDVTTGEVVISDPCYILQNKNIPFFWDDWLNETNFCAKVPEGTLILDKMGGDGEYVVHLKLMEIK
jgi:hypothetical protein